MSHSRYFDTPWRPPSKVPANERSSANYCCKRLRGLVNLYCWAMEWTIHRANRWGPDSESSGFEVHRSGLWLLNIETVSDIAGTDWRGIAAYASCQNSSGTKYSMDVKTLEWVEDELDELKGDFNADVISRAGICPPEQEHLLEPLPTVTGDDPVVVVQFHDGAGDIEWQECIPWLQISIALHQSFINAEKSLLAAGTDMESPPLFKNFERGRDLLEYMHSHKLEPRVVLDELDQYRRECCVKIDKALRWVNNSLTTTPILVGHNNEELVQEGTLPGGCEGKSAEITGQSLENTTESDLITPIPFH